MVNDDVEESDFIIEDRLINYYMKDLFCIQLLLRIK